MREENTLVNEGLNLIFMQKLGSGCMVAQFNDNVNQDVN